MTAKVKKVKIIDQTSLLNGGIYEVIEEFENGYFIRCHKDNGREFVLKIHTKPQQL
jgi:glutamate 5-kinase